MAVNTSVFAGFIFVAVHPLSACSEKYHQGAYNEGGTGGGGEQTGADVV